jgi:hypothetical protein
MAGNGVRPGRGSSSASAAATSVKAPHADHLVEHLAPGGARCFGTAIWAAGLWGLRQGDQQRLLAEGQGFRLMAEIGKAGGPHPFQIPAVGSQRQVERQKLALGKAGLKLDRADHLDQLGRQGPRARLQQSGGLHGEGGGP